MFGPALRSGLIAAIEEIAVREIAVGRIDGLPGLEPQLTELAVRVLTPGAQR